MKKISLLGLILIFLASCSSSQYAGQWQSNSNGKTYNLTINNDGSVSANWIGTDGQKKSKEGSWESADDGSIIIDGVNATASAKIENGNKLKFKTRKNQLVFTKVSGK